MRAEEAARGEAPPRGDNRIVQGLWVGPELSVMEQLSVSSFMRHGHEYHLYAYKEVRNVPAGAVLKDAGEILPASSIFQYKHQASYAGFANFFRYKLLLERGGWWADADAVCLRPLDFEEGHVFSSEWCRGAEVINCGNIKAPAGSPAMDYAWGVCRTKNPQELVWGETGPRLMAEAVERCGLGEYKKPYTVFCPLGYSEWHRVLEPEFDAAFGEETRAVHLWNEMWRVGRQDKNAAYHPDCFYERLKRRYLTRQA